MQKQVWRRGLRACVAKMIGDESRGRETRGGDVDGLAERLQQERSEARE